ncbi:MAG: 30S ribosomal protein S6 [Ruminococcaceae bacterium]|mgnify:FL=1|nr:30S ribosomal protein S6 [Oscillospiraceae bacterium]
MAEKLIYSYETIFIIDASLEEDAIKALTEKFTALISKNGTLESVDEWGKRRLAYEIDDKTEGYYVLANFKADGDFPKELDRKFRITDGILRTIIIRKED